MLNLKEGSPLEMLRQFAVDLNADLIEDHGASKLILDNDRGTGRISLYEVFPGLTAWVYNIKFSEKYHINTEFAVERPYYFGYHVSGFQQTKFSNEDEYRKIGEGQNFIVVSEPDNSSEFIIPSNIKYQCCYLIINPNQLKDSPTKIKGQLEQNLSEIFAEVDTEEPYRYFGNIDLRTGLFAEIIVKNQRTDLVGRLLTEGAILNMLASQIEAHDHDMNTKSFQPELSKSELVKISSIGDYLKENIGGKVTIKNLAEHLGLSPKKLQSGVRFLYGYSVNQYLTNLRMEVARERIHTTDQSLSEICYTVGFSSKSYFSKLFRERFGMLPRDYKNSFKKDNLLFEVTYRSMAKADISNADIEEILRTSRVSNRAHNITGSLIYHRKVFFQLIEGPKREILELYDKIKNDSRHFDIATMWQGAKPSRDFADWSLAMLSDSGILNIPHEGSTKNLNLGHLMGDIDDHSLVSQNLWRKVRNEIKTSSLVSTE